MKLYENCMKLYEMSMKYVNKWNYFFEMLVVVISMLCLIR